MSRRRWCRSAGGGGLPGSEGPASVCGVKDPSIWYGDCRRGPRPADQTPSRSWRLPDLLFLSGHSDGRDRLETRRSPPAGVRAPHRAIAPCSAREAVALRGHPLYYECFRWVDPVRSVGSPHPRPIALHCPPLRGRNDVPAGTTVYRTGVREAIRLRGAEFEHCQVWMRRRGAPGGEGRLLTIAPGVVAHIWAPGVAEDDIICRCEKVVEARP